MCVCVCVCARVHVCVCLCLYVKHNLVQASVFFETENLWQTTVLTVLSQTQTLWHTLLNYQKHRQLHSLSYGYCTREWHSVSCSYVAVAFYWVLQKTGPESTSKKLCFSVEMKWNEKKWNKVGSVYTIMVDALQFWYLESLYYHLHTVVYNIMWCAKHSCERLWLHSVR